MYAPSAQGFKNNCLTMTGRSEQNPSSNNFKPPCIASMGDHSHGEVKNCDDSIMNYRKSKYNKAEAHYGK